MQNRPVATLAIRQGVFIGQRSGAVPDADAEGTGVDPATGTSSPCENQRPVRCQSLGGEHWHGKIEGIVEKKKDCHGGNRSSQNRGTIRQIRLPCYHYFTTKQKVWQL